MDKINETKLSYYEKRMIRFFIVNKVCKSMGLKLVKNSSYRNKWL